MIKGIWRWLIGEYRPEPIHPSQMVRIQAEDNYRGLANWDKPIVNRIPIVWDERLIEVDED